MTIKVNNYFGKFKILCREKARAYVVAVLTYGAAQSKSRAPIAYGTLVNSQSMSVREGVNNVTGTLSYNTDYAKHLELNKNWRPKPPPKYGYKGKSKANAWNPKSRWGYLRLAFEGSKESVVVRSYRSKFKV